MFIKKENTLPFKPKKEVLFAAGDLPYALVTLRGGRIRGGYQFSDDFLRDIAKAIVANLNESLKCNYRGTYFNAYDTATETSLFEHLKSSLEDFSVQESEKSKLNFREAHLKRELVGKALGKSSLYATITGEGVNTSNLSRVYYHKSVTNLINILCHFISNLLGNSKGNPLASLKINKDLLASNEIKDQVRSLVMATVKEVLEKSALSIAIDDYTNTPTVIQI